MRSIMGMDISDFLAGEKFADARIGLTGQSEGRIAQISLLIKAAQRNRPAFEHRRGPVDIFGSFIGRFADINGVGRTIRRRDIVADMVEQVQVFAFFRIFQRHAAGKAPAGRCLDPAGIDRSQFSIAHRKQMRMGSGG